MLIDTHAHLNDERLIPEAEEIALNLKSDGLAAIVDVGFDRKTSEIAVAHADAFDGVFAVVGIHPHDSQYAGQADYDYFSEVSKKEKVVAIGEIGLDFYYDLSDRKTQERVFLEQLELAHGLKLPVVIHLRDAYELMLRLLKDNRRYLEYGSVLHCYSGSTEMLKEFAKLEMYFSYGGAVTFKNANKGDVVRAMPRDRLLLETDCPYMTPVPNRGKTNYPKYVYLTAEKIQEFLPEVDVNAVSYENSLNFYKKMKI